MISPNRKLCAIYTRKSTEEGPGMDFNSLDAQREACAAYILSKAGEGWEQVGELYDYGGWSGGSMICPALKQLLDPALPHYDQRHLHRLARASWLAPAKTKLVPRNRARENSEAFS